MKTKANFAFNIGSRHFIFRAGNYSNRKFIPFVNRGPLGSFTISLSWMQIESGPGRWY